jgi:hypothetical protein
MLIKITENRTTDAMKNQTKLHEKSINLVILILFVLSYLISTETLRQLISDSLQKSPSW